MLSNIEEEGGNSLEGISHELLIRRDDDDDQLTTNGSTSLNLAQGENWLRLVASIGNNSVLQDTQETAMGTKPFPSIASLSEVGTIDAPSEDCYICIDVDGPYVAIKDMRAPISSQETEEEAMFDVCLARRKQQHEKLAELADSQEQGGGKYHALERLERRQLRMIHQGDCIVTRNNGAVGGPTSDLVLEYHRYNGETTRKAQQGEEMSQDSENVEENAAAASGGTEASKPSDRPQTQPDGPTPGLSDYQTAVESHPTNDSDDDETSYEGDEADATQVFARSSVLSTQSPERERDSDDETAMDADPLESEKDQSFLTTPGRESELVAMGTQLQESSSDAERAAETERRMDASTQSISSKDNDADSDEQNGHRRGGYRMSPIVEESEINGENGVISDRKKETQETTNGSVANDKLEKPPSWRASTTMEDSQKGDDSGDDTMTDNNEDEEEEDSDSDALLDDDDIKDASADVPVTPQKSHSATAANTVTQAANGQSLTKKDGPTRARAPGNEAMSDASSITEIDEETPVKSRPKDGAINAAGDSQKPVAAAAREPLTGTVDDTASRSSASITEPGDLISPRKGLAAIALRESGVDGKATLSKTTDEQEEAKEVAAVALAEIANTETLNETIQEEAMPRSSDQEEAVDETGSKEIVDKDIVKNASKAFMGEEEGKDAFVDSSGKKIEENRNAKKVDEDSAEGNQIQATIASQSSKQVVKAVEGVAAETSEENTTMKPVEGEDTGSSMERSQSTPPKEFLSHSEDTEVTNNKSSSVNHYVESSGEKEAAGIPASNTKNIEAEAEDVKEENECPSSLSDRKTAPDEPHASFESDRMDAKESEETSSPIADEPSEEKAPVVANALKVYAATSTIDEEVTKRSEDAESMEFPTNEKAATDKSSTNAKTAKTDTKAAKDNVSPDSAEASGEEATVDSSIAVESKPPPRQALASRRKAGPAQKESVEEEAEEDHKDSVKPPAKKRARSSRTKAKAEPEEEPEKDKSLKTPTKKRTTRAAGYDLRGSSRKRARGAGTPAPGEEPTRVLMTGVGESEKEKKMIASIGGELIEKIEDAHTATHIIAGDDQNSLRRTPKLMIGICRTSNIVHLDWLIKSAKAREPLPCNEFLLLKDKKAERLYGFKMRESLQRGEALRQNNEFLLSGYWVYVCNGVPGNKAPPEKEFELIVTAAGAKWLSSLGTRVIKDLDASKILVITPEKPHKKNAKSSEVTDIEKAIKRGAHDYPASWLFRCIIRQSLDE